tara:strand:+ start:69107 stop:70105 length:999 start_codon:yes stop_codon:yes gene_type:complete
MNTAGVDESSIVPFTPGQPGQDTPLAVASPGVQVPAGATATPERTFVEYLNGLMPDIAKAVRDNGSDATACANCQRLTECIRLFLTCDTAKHVYEEIIKLILLLSVFLWPANSLYLAGITGRYTGYVATATTAPIYSLIVYMFDQLHNRYGFLRRAGAPADRHCLSHALISGLGILSFGGAFTVATNYLHSIPLEALVSATGASAVPFIAALSVRENHDDYASLDEVDANARSLGSLARVAAAKLHNNALLRIAFVFVSGFLLSGALITQQAAKWVVVRGPHVDGDAVANGNIAGMVTFLITQGLEVLLFLLFYTWYFCRTSTVPTARISEI